MYRNMLLSSVMAGMVGISSIAHADTTKVLCAEGDSIRRRDPSTLDIPGVTLRNNGVDGSTTRSLLASGFEKGIAGSGCDAYSISYGANDIRNGTSVAGYIENIARISTAVLAAGKKIIIETPPPLNRASYDNNLIAAYGVAVKEYVDKVNNPNLKYSDAYTAIYNTPGWKNGMLDSTHIGPELSRIKMNILQNALSSM